MSADILLDPLVLHAVLATFFSGIASALIGVLVVTMRLSLIGVCMAHAAFAGGLLGLVFGINPLAPAMLCCLVAAAALGPTLPTTSVEAWISGSLPGSSPAASSTSEAQRRVRMSRAAVVEASE